VGRRAKECRVLMGKSEVKRPLGRSRHRLKDKLKWILKKLDGRMWTGLIWLRIETNVGLLCTL